MNEQRLHPNEELEIDILDLFAELCIKWKWIIGLMLLLGILMGVITGLRGEQKPVVEESQLESARSQLTEEQISQVEYTYAQYLSYKQYKQSMQEYLATSLYTSDNFNSDVIERTVYGITSDIDRAGALFTYLALGKDEYAQVSKILLGTEEVSDEIFNRVYLGAAPGASGMQEVSRIDEDKLEKESLLTLTVIAEDQKKADEATVYLEGVLQQHYEKLLDTYPEMSFKKIGSQYSYDVLGFLQNRQNTVMSNLSSTDNALNNLDNNVVSKMDSDSKAYYDLLKERDEAETAVAKKPRYVRNIAIGLFLGFIISAFAIILIYIFRGSVNTIDELRWMLNGDMPKLIAAEDNRRVYNPFLFIAGSIRKGRGNIKVTNEKMAAEDLAITIEKRGQNKIYFVDCCNSDNESRHLMNSIEERLDKLTISPNVFSGKPLSNPDELKKLSEADAAVFVVERKQTPRTLLNTLVQRCSNYGVDILDVLVL